MAKYVFLGNINCPNWSEQNENLNRSIKIKQLENITNELTRK